MSKMTWDAIGERKFEVGVENVAIFPMTESTYGAGVPWNGCTAFNIQPQGGEANKYYADDIHYLTLYSAETTDFTVEAYTYPDEFAACNGQRDLVNGVKIGQQTRKAFGAAFVNLIGNDTELQDHGKKITLVYGCRVSPSEKGHATNNENLEPATMSWSGTTTPIKVEGHKATATCEVDSTIVGDAAFKAVYDYVYGSETAEPTFPTPEKVAQIVTEAQQGE
jgi:hypothetical protein